MPQYINGKIMVRLSLFFTIGMGILNQSCKRSSDSAVRGGEEVSPSVGGAFNDALSRPSSHSCLKNFKGPKIQIFPSESFSSDLVSNFESVLNSLDINTSVSFSLGFIKGEASANFASQVRSSNTEVTLMISSKKITHVEVSTNAEVDPRMNQLSEADFAAQCGDRFIDTVSYGGKFHAFVKFTFKSVEASSRFAAHVRAKIFGIKAKASFSEVLSQSEINNATVKLDYFQQGGGNIPFTMNTKECALANYEACRLIIEKIFNFAEKEFLDGVNQDNSHWIEYSTRTYPGKSSTKDLDLIKQRDEAAIQLSKNLEHQSYIQDLKRRPGDYSKRVAQKIEDIEKQILLDHETIKTSLNRCISTGEDRFDCGAPLKNLKIMEIMRDQVMTTNYMQVRQWFLGYSQKGGADFEKTCSNFLVGFKITPQNGGGIKDIIPICDDPGVEHSTATCNPGEVVVGLRGTNSAGGVGNLGITCGNPGTSPQTVTDKSINGDGKFVSAQMRCPKDYAASGVYGKGDGKVGLIQLGVICKRF